MIQGRPSRDREQPVNERSARIETVDISERLEKRVLGQIFGVLTLPRHLVNEIENPPTVYMNDRFERPRIAAHGFANQDGLIRLPALRIQRAFIAVGLRAKAGGMEFSGH